MRLSTFEINSIIETFKEVFGVGKIYLFGSRTDNSKKGGDIDLFVDVPETEDVYRKKIEFLTKLQRKIGEQKIDIVFKKDKSRLIEKEVDKTKVELDLDKIFLSKYFEQCDRHIQRIEEAYEDIREKIPLDVKSYQNLDKDTVQALDQYLFRFSKLQDTIGEKIFKTILKFYDDRDINLPFLDMLNKLEKLGYIHSTKEWINLRKIRNEISHHYDDEPEEMSQAINMIVVQKGNIIKIYETIKNKYESDLR